MARMFRQCPHCKSKVGFKISYHVKGYGHEDRTFKGKVLDAGREVFDDHESFAECLSCGKLIDAERLEIM